MIAIPRSCTPVHSFGNLTLILVALLPSSVPGIVFQAPHAGACGGGLRWSGGARNAPAYRNHHQCHPPPERAWREGPAHQGAHFRGAEAVRYSLSPCHVCSVLSRFSSTRLEWASLILGWGGSRPCSPLIFVSAGRCRR